MRQKITHIVRNPLFQAFILPMLLWTVCTWQPPLGNNTLIFSDCREQYYPFFLAFREALLSSESLQWTWSLGMGTDYLGLIAYYCTSPLYLPALLMPENWLLSYFCLLTPIKLALASLTMTFFLKNLTGREDKALPIFGCLYSFCGWSLIFSLNIMWLDGLYMLPLVTWSTIRLLRDQRTLPYILTLTATLLFNYYISIFICMFVFLLFYCYQFCKWQGAKQFVLSLVRITISTIVVLCLAAVILIPAAHGLLNSSATQQSTIPVPITKYLIPVADQSEAAASWQILRSTFEGNGAIFPALWTAVKTTIPLICKAIGHTIYQAALAGFYGNAVTSPPAIYCGIATIVLTFLCLLSKEKPKREKIAYILILAIYALGMVFNGVSYVYHGFHYPAGFSYRFTFILSFITITTAYQSWLRRENTHPWQALLAGGMTIGYLLLSARFRASGIKEVNIFAIALFTLGMMSYKTVRVKHTATEEVPDADGAASNRQDAKDPAPQKTKMKATASPASRRELPPLCPPVFC